ncbi:MAG: arsenate reductase family protein [Pseudorhodobacter sp.]
MTVTVYGIPTCDTCRKALKALQGAGHEASLRDIRKSPLGAEEIAEFIAIFGDEIINRKSTSWRKASDALKGADPAEQLASEPTLMKRPVIRSAAGLTLGWGSQVQAQYL